MAAALSARLMARSDVLLPRPKDSLVWPSSRYRQDPVAFFREVLGVSPHPKQIAIIESIRDNKRVAVASGHKIGKSCLLAGIALWFYCAYPDARVVMSSTTSRQVDAILWRELRMMHARAKHKIDGEPHELARSGLKSPDFREITGFTAREAEAVAGISGANLLYLIDEASGVPDLIFEAIEGNRAGGARIVMMSNPTRTDGRFYDAFDTKKAFWQTFQVSSEEVADLGIPGLATREWIDEMRLEWGEDSAFYKIRIKGQFVVGEEGKIISLHTITQAELRWHDTQPDGRLYVGLDPAGPGGMGDETVFATRRGRKILSLTAMRGLSEEGILVHLLGVLRQHAHARELPVVVLDREGEVGAKVWAVLRAYSFTHPEAFELVGVRSSGMSPDPRRTLDRVRDELWANLRDWLKEGGAVPQDTKLSKELHAPDWALDSHNRQKATDKKELRKMLGRSPDRADAVALAVWECAAPGDGQGDGPPRIEHEPDQSTGYANLWDATLAMDPYG
jgi:phage terminase large subunit